MRFRRRLASSALLALLGPITASAEIVSASNSGFLLRQQRLISAPPMRVHERFFDVAAWWSAAHTYSGDAANLSLRNEPGGCWCERLRDGGFVRHLSLEYSAPGSLVRLSGGLGPLQGIGAAGMLALELKADSAGTQATLTYAVSGYQPGAGLQSLAAPVDTVLSEQFDRLKAYVEKH